MQQEEIKRKEKQAEMAAILKAQMKEVEERRKREKEADKHYLEGVNEDVKQYYIESDTMHKKELEKFENNRRIWTEQVCLGTVPFYFSIVRSQKGSSTTAQRRITEIGTRRAR